MMNTDQPYLPALVMFLYIFRLRSLRPGLVGEKRCLFMDGSGPGWRSVRQYILLQYSESDDE